MKLFDAEKYRGRRVCVALSGGVDSVCLLHSFMTCSAQYGITLTAAHLEHGIRGEESLRDLAFCEELCAQWNIPLFVEHADVPKLIREQGGGVEQTARTVRYAFFQKLLRENRVDFIATAHHLNDVAETVLFRLARGTAPAGMRTITEYEGIVRPLLSVTREQILAYADINGLPHVEDSTNQNTDYARNRIRHTVLPALGEISAHAAEHLVHFANIVANDDAYLDSLAREKIVRRSGEECVPVDLPDALFFRACLQCMHCTVDYTSANLEEIARLRNLQSGKRASLPGGRMAVREGNFIVFCVPAQECEGEISFTPAFGEYTIPAPFCIAAHAQGNGTGIELTVDLDAFPGGCVVRTRREGDVITPYHGRGKTLKKFLTDRKIPARLGRKLPLIAKGNEVLVVVGVEIADSVKVTNSTVRRGYIR